MRKIIFRAFSHFDNRWHYGVPAYKMDDTLLTNSDMFDDDDNYGIICSYECIDGTTLGQYVGINDKNGCYIYEGDIIRAVLPETVACREYVWPLMAVSFHEGAFGVWQNARDFTPLRSFASRVEFEVVGNIHDNPDMIGGA